MTKKIKQEKQKNSYDYDRDYNDKMKHEKQKELPSGLQKNLKEVEHYLPDGKIN